MTDSELRAAVRNVVSTVVIRMKAQSCSLNEQAEVLTEGIDAIMAAIARFECGAPDCRQSSGHCHDVTNYYLEGSDEIIASDEW